MVMNLFHLRSLNFGNNVTVNGLKVIKYFLLLFLFTGISFADTNANKDFNFLNELRLSANLSQLKWNPQLGDSAQNHAKFLSSNNRYGHHQQKGLKHFTGQWASDRAIYSNYENRLVGENVTSKTGEKRYFNPIDGLMSAIYHRFNFLNLDKNEVGIGHQKGQLNSYVYVMGNSALSEVCQLPDFVKKGSYSFDICTNKKKKIDTKLTDEAAQRHQLKNPKFVVWPSNNSKNITPAFYQETPDPLPHHDVSGYPISIQFNPSYYNIPPKIKTFEIRETEQQSPLKVITLMNQQNDPNNMFNEYQHAIFPEKRLAWDTSYSVKVDYINQDNQQIETINWSFHSKNFKQKVYQVTQNNQIIKVKVGQKVILYFPPKNAQDIQNTVRTKDFNMQLELNYIDKNTLKAHINHKGKAEINFHNKTVELNTNHWIK